MPYAVLLPEISMPRMDGFTPAEKIRKIDTKIRVFFMTVLDVDYEALLENNGGCLIRKLRDVDDLVKRVKRNIISKVYFYSIRIYV